MALRLADRPASSGSYANNLREFESVREFMTSASLLTLVDLPFLLLFIFVISIVGGKLAWFLWRLFRLSSLSASSSNAPCRATLTNP